MKHSFTIATLYGLLLITQAHAEAPLPSKPFQFYMGIASGIETMAGKRSESLDEENQRFGAPNRIITTYTNNLSMSERSGIGSLMAGFLWKIPNVPILMGPEIYIGRGSTASSFSDVRLDPFNLALREARYYTTDFQRKLFSGVLIRAGYQFCEKYLAYLSLGFDRSQFSIKRALRHEQAVATTMVKRSKTLNGVVFGIGLERAFAQFIVGFDFKAIQYQTYNSMDNVQVAPGVTPAFLNFSVQPRIKMYSLRIAYRF